MTAALAARTHRLAFLHANYGQRTEEKELACFRLLAAHFAAERNTGPATLALLVEHGADLTARDADGFTPQDLARRNGKGRLVEWIERRQ